MQQSYERLNALAKINSATSYLEVGVNKGKTFKLVDVPVKIAVDPNFRFDFENYATDQVRFHQLESDSYFTKHAMNDEPFDLIFLDGLHTFEQTFRDFCASIRYSRPGTIWLIDDTCPTMFVEAWRSHTFNRRVRKLFKMKGKGWLGDVFKTIFAIHDFFPQYSYATFDGRGQTVVWMQAREDFKPIWNSLGKITRSNYFDFSRHKNTYMNMKTDSELLELVMNGAKNLGIENPGIDNVARNTTKGN